MSKIKLMIEIAQEIYEHAKNTSEDRTDEYSAMRAIANGIPLNDLKEIYIGMDGNAVQIYPNNEVLDKIRAEIDAIEIHGQVDTHTAFIRTGEQVKQMALDIIDRYMKGE